MRTRLFIAMVVMAAGACGGKSGEASAPAQEAVGKTHIEVPEFEVSESAADVAKGEQLFAGKGCVACHKVGGGKLVGPDLKGVMSRRDETWVKKMILHPDVMLKEDETARKLLAEHLTPMPNQGVDGRAELPYLMAYLRSAR